MEDLRRIVRDLEMQAEKQRSETAAERKRNEYCPRELICSISLSEFLSNTKQVRLSVSNCNVKTFENRYKCSDDQTPLEHYFKTKALEDDSTGINRVFVLLNKNNTPVFYYSLRIGVLLEALPVYTETDMPILLSSNSSQPTDMSRCDSTLQTQYNKDLKFEQDRPMVRVEKIIPAIEISYFAKNTKLNGEWKKVNSGGQTIAQVVFDKFTFPEIKAFAKEIGAKYIVLFAAAESKTDSKKQQVAYEKLIGFYNKIGFRQDTKMIPIKPKTDLGSIFMYRPLDSVCSS